MPSVGGVWIFSGITHYDCCLLTVGINTVAVFKNSEDSFKIFDSYSKDLYGMPQSFGKCTLLSIEGIENVVSYLQISCLQTGVVPFEVKGVIISDSKPDLESVHNTRSQKNENLSWNDELNPKQLVNRKQKCSSEIADVKEKQSTARSEYEKLRRAIILKVKNPGKKGSGDSLKTTEGNV